MSNTPPDLKGTFDTPRAADPPRGEEVLPSWDAPEAVPVAIPVAGDAADDIPLATPVAEALPAEPPTAEPIEEPPAEPVAEGAPAAEPTSIACPACATPSPLDAQYCSDCGYYFSPADLAAARSGAAPAAIEAPPTETQIPTERILGRYELRELVSDRLGVQRFKALDHGSGAPTPVVVVRQALPAVAEAVPAAEPVDPTTPEDEGELRPTLDDVSFGDFVPGAFPTTEVIPVQAAWPGIAWERRLLNTLEGDGLPAEVDHFTDDRHEYLVVEVPTGQLLWDAWDDPDVGWGRKFRYLAELAEALHRLHQCNAMLEGLRPDIVVIDNGKVRICDLSDLLPLPFPPDAPVRGRLYTAPELVNGQGIADARADLYSFGAMLYALHVGRELNERTDFDGPGNPKPFIPQFPDCHPAFGRLMMKTFRKEVHSRFPTDEASKQDATGFLELIRTLEVLARTYDNVRLEIASWTSTGIVRTGNEDAFALLHAAESRQDDLGEAALIILCDGMGGYEAGEVAAAMTIGALRKALSKLPPFNVAAGESPFPTDPQASVTKSEGHAGPPVDVEQVKQAIKQALRDANKLVFQTSRAPGSKRRGMGCTAEVVFIDGRNVIVGHVGDSRTYHLHEGRLVQLTRDQTLVNRLVELGSLTEEEAETHPRRNELQQAIGGQPDVEPGLYHGRMSAGDWVVVCSDGLTNHVNSRDLSEMLLREAWSAETAARRLVNLTLIEGATDNVTVVAVRAT